MPEGDTIFRTARTLHRALGGALVARFESAYPSLTRVNDDDPVVGRTVESVESRGKHVLMAFSGGLVLRTHMRMHGSWHIYRPGEAWQRPARDMRVLVGTDRFVAVGFNVPEAEFVRARDLSRHRRLGALGPDLLDPAFDRVEALRRLRAQGIEPIGEALLNQRVVAGIGNVFRSEVLFVAGIHPSTPVATLTDAALSNVLEAATDLLRVNVRDRTRTLAPAPGRRTTGSLHPGKALWVYGRAGDACRRCGAVIRLDKRGTDSRLIYWCPTCQPRDSGS